jgi:hypothetical protein
MLCRDMLLRCIMPDAAETLHLHAAGTLAGRYATITKARDRHASCVAGHVPTDAYLQVWERVGLLQLLAPLSLIFPQQMSVGPHPAAALPLKFGMTLA